MSDTPHKISTPDWPVAVAMMSALIGMGSCGVSALIPPYVLLVAPLVAFWATVFTFEVVVALREPSGTERQRRTSSRDAAGAAWIVSIVVCTAWGYLLESVFSRTIGKEDLGITTIGVITGVVLGGLVARGVHRRAQSYYDLVQEEQG